jgi:hypothetical protein
MNSEISLSNRLNRGAILITGYLIRNKTKNLAGGATLKLPSSRRVLVFDLVN